MRYGLSSLSEIDGYSSLSSSDKNKLKTLFGSESSTSVPKPVTPTTSLFGSSTPVSSYSPTSTFNVGSSSPAKQNIQNELSVLSSNYSFYGDISNRINR